MQEIRRHCFDTKEPNVSGKSDENCENVRFKARACGLYDVASTARREKYVNGESTQSYDGTICST